MRPLAGRRGRGSRAGERGVTLTELVIVLAILALLVLVVGPLFAQWLRSYKVGSAARQIQAELRLARSVAVSLNSSVTMTVKGTEVSWTDAQGRLRQFTLPGGVAITNLADPVNGDPIIFRSSGQPEDPSKTLVVDGWVHDDVHDAWTLRIGTLGKVTLERSIVTVGVSPGGGGGGEGGAGGGGGGGAGSHRR